MLKKHAKKINGEKIMKEKSKDLCSVNERIAEKTKSGSSTVLKSLSSSTNLSNYRIPKKHDETNGRKRPASEKEHVEKKKSSRRILF